MRLGASGLVSDWRPRHWVSAHVLSSTITWWDGPIGSRSYSALIKDNTSNLVKRCILTTAQMHSAANKARELQALLVCSIILILQSGPQSSLRRRTGHCILRIGI